jgi:thiamine phosphate synthase YjbQ (UPF0047 family)
MKTLEVWTGSRTEMIAVTRQLQQLVQEKGWMSGALLVYCSQYHGGGYD